VRIKALLKTFIRLTSWKKRKEIYKMPKEENKLWNKQPIPANRQRFNPKMA